MSCKSLLPPTLSFSPPTFPTLRGHILLLCLLSPLLYGCSLTYLAKTGYHQLKVLHSRTHIDKILQNPLVNKTTKEKLLLVKEVKGFAENILKLNKSDNYNSFVQLDRPYVTYLLRVSLTDQLESYQWSFPFMGRFPYKGYFRKEEAQAAARKFPENKYDTYVRGVSAYSTLGWFDDPIFSSMLRYKDSDLVNTIIHETFHATLFIKGHADFNERLATFVGYVGTEMFYRRREGESSPIVQRIKDENHDKKLFSEFISKELKGLGKWYQTNRTSLTKESKFKRLREIQDSFSIHLKPRLKTSGYDYFPGLQLNNAVLLSYKTYMSDLSDFEKLYIKMGRNFFKMMKYLKTLKGAKNPEKTFNEYMQETNGSDEAKGV